MEFNEYYGNLTSYVSLIYYQFYLMNVLLNCNSKLNYYNYLIITTASKPVYLHFGNVFDYLELYGVIQVLYTIATNNDEEVNYINMSDIHLYFTKQSHLIFVFIIQPSLLHYNSKDNEHILDDYTHIIKENCLQKHNRYLYYAVYHFNLLFPFIYRKLEENINFDCLEMVNKHRDLLHYLIEYLHHNFYSIVYSEVPKVYLSKHYTNSTQSILAPIPKELSSSFVFSFLLINKSIVAINYNGNKDHISGTNIHTLALIANYVVNNNKYMCCNATVHMLPLCLPSYSTEGYLYVHITNLKQCLNTLGNANINLSDFDATKSELFNIQLVQITIDEEDKLCLTLEARRIFNKLVHIQGFREMISAHSLVLSNCFLSHVNLHNFFYISNLDSLFMNRICYILFYNKNTFNYYNYSIFHNEAPFTPQQDSYSILNNKYYLGDALSSTLFILLNEAEATCTSLGCNTKHTVMLTSLKTISKYTLYLAFKPNILAKAKLKDECIKAHSVMESPLNYMLIILRDIHSISNSVRSGNLGTEPNGLPFKSSKSTNQNFT